MAKKHENTLGWGGDGDEIDVILGLESFFSIEIENHEAEALMNVGDIYDLIKRKIPDNKTAAEVCYTAHCFYRLRRGLRHISKVQDLRPDTKIGPLTHKIEPKAFKKDLEELTGLKLPELDYKGIGSIGFAMVFLSWIPFIMDRFSSLESTLLFFALAGWGINILNMASGSLLSKDYITLGDLAKKTAAINYRQLVLTKKDKDKNGLWNTLDSYLRDCGEGSPPPVITRETVFF